MIKFVAVLVFLAGGVSAQVKVSNIEAEGNLKPTHQLKCIGPNEYRPEYSPADLATGLSKCLKENKLSEAADLVVEIQVRGRFDAYRVKDKTGHQGVQVLLLTSVNKAGKRGEARYKEAMKAFGGVGSPRHRAACQRMNASGAPRHSPSYMVQHGMDAVLGKPGNGLVKNFDPDATWKKTLSGYFKCGT